MKIISVTLTLGALLAGTAAVAQTTSQDFGSAVYQTVRNCPANATVDCSGNNTDQRTRGTKSAGGGGQSASSTYAISSSAVITGAGGAFGSVTFDQFGFPDIKAKVSTVGNVRIGDNIYAYQSYTYTGSTPLLLELEANFHIVNSTTDNATGARPKGALASAGFAIWRRADFFYYASEEYQGAPGGFNSAVSLISASQIFGQNVSCSTNFGTEPRPLAANFTDQVLTGGSTNISVSQDVCGLDDDVLDDSLTFNRGDQFVIASYAQLFANRGGFADATSTFTLGLAPDTSPAARAAFQNNVVLGAVDVAPVPELASWAMLIAGFGVIGGALRRRKERPAVAAV